MAVALDFQDPFESASAMPAASNGPPLDFKDPFDPSTAKLARASIATAPPSPSLADQAGNFIKSQFGTDPNAPSYTRNAAYLIDNPITRGLGSAATGIAQGAAHLIRKGVGLVSPDAAATIKAAIEDPLRERETAFGTPTDANAAEAATAGLSRIAGAAPAFVLGGVSGAAGLAATNTGEELSNREAAGQETTQGQVAGIGAANLVTNFLPAHLGGSLTRRLLTGAGVGLAGSTLNNVASGQPLGTGAVPATLIGAAFGGLHRTGMEPSTGIQPGAESAPSTTGALTHEPDFITDAQGRTVANKGSRNLGQFVGPGVDQQAPVARPPFPAAPPGSLSDAANALTLTRPLLLQHQPDVMVDARGRAIVNKGGMTGRPPFGGPGLDEQAPARPLGDVSPEPTSPSPAETLTADTDQATPSPSPFQTPDEAHQQDFADRLGGIARARGLDPAVVGAALQDLHPSLPRDETTGFYKADQLNPTAQRAQQWSAETGQPAAYVEGDIGNLEGLKQQLGAQGADEVTRQIADLAQQHLADTGATITPVRKADGDFGFVVAGADKEAATAAMAKAQDQVEALAEKKGLDTLLHANASREPGITLHFGASDIAPNAPLSDTFQSADRLTQYRKETGDYEFRGPTEPAGAGEPTEQPTSASTEALPGSADRPTGSETGGSRGNAEPGGPSQPDTTGVEPIAGRPSGSGSPAATPETSPGAGQLGAVLQNRDRSRAASVEQMQAIANHPDPDRLGFSRTPETGAPMVSVGGNDTKAIPESAIGKSSTVTMADGTKVPVRYAAVEASQVLASHDVNGTPNPTHAAAPKPGEIRALNNGRAAAISAAYDRGTADNYKRGLIATADEHGVDPQTIEGMTKPMLVRVYDEAHNAGEIGAQSNNGGGLGLSSAELAVHDARNLGGLDDFKPGENGELVNASNMPFIRRFMQSIPENQRGDLMDATGQPTRQLRDRIQAAIFHKAYDSPELTAALSEEANPDVKNILSGLVTAAPDFVQVDKTDALGNIAGKIAKGVGVLKDARDRGMSVAQLTGQGDLLGRDPEADIFAHFMGDSARSGKRMGVAFKAMGRFIADQQQSTKNGDMFGRTAPNFTEAIQAANDHLRDVYGEDAAQLKAHSGDFFTAGGKPSVESGGSAGAGARVAPDRRGGGEPGAVERTETGDAGAEPESGSESVDRTAFLSRRKGAVVSSGRTVADVTSWIAGAKAKLGDNAPDVRVLQSHADAPPAIRRSQGFDNHVEGVYHDGKVYLFADALHTRERALQVLGHEVIGHYGLEHVMGDAWGKLVDDLHTLRAAGKGSDALKRIFAETEQLYPADRDAFASEAMAIMAERGVNNTFMQRAFAAIRQFLRKIGIDVKFSEGDLRNSLVESRKFVTTNENEAGAPLAQRLVTLVPKEEPRKSPIGGSETTGTQAAGRSGVIERLLLEAHAGNRDVGDLPPTVQASRAGLSISDAHVPSQIEKASQLWRAKGTDSPFFKRWFGSSKVTNKDGKPTPVYHGTSDEFHVFDKGKSGSNTAHMTAPLGHFFAEDRAKAARYAEKASQGVPADEHVVDAYLSLQRPKELSLADFMKIDSQDEARALRTKLEREGYDGIHLKDADQWVAFHSGQIKSIDNRGTFDAANPDVRFSKTPSETREPEQNTPDETAKRTVFRRAANAIRSLYDMNEAQTQRILARGDIRAAWAQKDRAIGEADTATRAMMDYYDKRPADVLADPRKALADVIAFQKGEPIPDPHAKPFFDTISTLLDKQAKEIQSFGKGYLDHLIENYFPQMWKDPARAEQFQANQLARRPLAGDKRFTRERVFGNYEEGIKAGFEPVSHNPVDMLMARYQSGEKLLATLRTMQALEDRGDVRPIGQRERVPFGWARVNDPSFNSKVVPTLIAKDLNNHLDPGLTRFAPWRSFRYMENVLLSARLGLSFLHAAMTTIDTLVSHAAVGWQSALAGDFSGALKQLAATVTSPVLSPRKGGRLLRQFEGKEAPDIQTAALFHFLTQGGMRARMSPTDYNRDLVQFNRAWKQGDLRTATLKSIPAALESTTHLITHYLIPAQKMTARVLLAKFELDRLARILGTEKGDYAATVAAMRPDALRQIAYRINADVDDRLGQFAYENVFWNKTVKDVLHASVQSVGWNFGSLRLILGGIKDIVRLLHPESYVDALDKEGKITDMKMSRLTNRLAYLITLNATMAMAGALLQHALTGQWPSSTKDYYFPRTGRKNPDDSDERLSFPTYVKDEFALTTHPIQTLEHKLHPALNMLTEIAKNKDFYGTQIYDPEASIPTEVQQFLTYLGKSFLPYAVQGASRARAAGRNAAMTALPFVGITPAPGDITKTPFQDYVASRYFDTLPQGARTQDAAEQSAKFRQAVMAERSGQTPDVTGLTPEEIRVLRTQATQQVPQYRFNKLPLVEKLRAWNMASPEERQTYGLRQSIIRSSSRELAKLPLDQRRNVQAQVNAVIIGR